MNDEKVWDEFPNKIDLGREESVPTSSPDGGKKSKAKTRMYYPGLYVNGVDGLKGLEGIEKEGYALIRYRLRSLNIRMPDDQDGGDKGLGASPSDGPSLDLEVRELCLPAAASDGSDDLKRAVAKFAKGKGLDTEGAEGSDEKVDEDEESEDKES